MCELERLDQPLLLNTRKRALPAQLDCTVQLSQRLLVVTQALLPSDVGIIQGRPLMEYAYLLNPADGMVAGVGHIQAGAIRGNAGGVVESRCRTRAIA